MPHIKFKPINNQTLEDITQRGSAVTFRADALNGDGDCVFGVRYGGEEFLLQLKRAPKSDMLKYDKVTRPLKVNLIKEVLAKLTDEFGLEIEHSNISISEYRPQPSSKYLKKIKDFESINIPFEMVAVEVGFGSGRHLLHQALQRPDRLHIGIEIHTPSAQQVLRQIEIQRLENIWIVNYDARLFLEMLPSNSCEQIFVHFPVPWDKKPHRRVISQGFTNEALRILAPQGRLELRTDSEAYFWYSLESFFALPKAKVVIDKNKDLAVVSKYEARWRKQEKDIYEVHLTAEEFSVQKVLTVDFSFGKVRYHSKILDNLPPKSIIMDDYFVHFEKLYKIGDDGLLIKVAFGSFDRPEHKYIILDETECRYYSSNPVKTGVNYLAHQKIMEYLYV
jgi:tRNA (guanine-N7-)-methyltransferase